MEVEADIQNYNKEENKQFIFDLLNKFQINQLEKIERKVNENYLNTSQNFELPKEKNFEAQYCHIYFNRLTQLKNIIINNLMERNIKPLESIIKIQQNEECHVIGSIYKQMKLKPNILNKLKDPSILLDKKQSYMSDDDQLFLEDNFGRVSLVLNNTYMMAADQTQRQVSTKNLISGIVVCIQGYLSENNKFHVTYIEFSGLPYQESILKLPKKPATFQNNNYNELNQYLQENNNDHFIAIASGFNIDQEASNIHLQMLKSFLKGCNLNSTMIKFSQRIERIVIAGNIVKQPQDLEQCLQGSFKMQDIKESMNQVEQDLMDLAQYIPIDLMPGSNDPSNKLLPQQPLNKCYFPRAFQCKSLTSVTNPYSFKLNQIDFLGTSGQNIQDLKKYSHFSDDDLEILEYQLMWSHIAPTAPDTLQCFPYSDRDAFFLEEMPQVYFAGNCQQFATKMFKEKLTGKFCRLICVPEFSITNSIVLINLNNLDTFEMKF